MRLVKTEAQFIQGIGVLVTPPDFCLNWFVVELVAADKYLIPKRYALGGKHTHPLPAQIARDPTTTIDGFIIEAIKLDGDGEQLSRINTAFGI